MTQQSRPILEKETPEKTSNELLNELNKLKKFTLNQGGRLMLQGNLLELANEVMVAVDDFIKNPKLGKRDALEDAVKKYKDTLEKANIKVIYDALQCNEKNCVEMVGFHFGDCLKCPITIIKVRMERIGREIQKEIEDKQ